MIFVHYITLKMLFYWFLYFSSNIKQLPIFFYQCLKIVASMMFKKCYQTNQDMYHTHSCLNTLVWAKYLDLHECFVILGPYFGQVMRARPQGFLQEETLKNKESNFVPSFEVWNNLVQEYFPIKILSITQNEISDSWESFCLQEIDCN